VLVGWWEDTWRGRLYYYYYERNGTVDYTTKRPKNLTLPLFYPEGKGYWFNQDFGLVICWRDTGSVEKFGFAGAVPWQNLPTILQKLPGIPGTWNDSEPLLTKKL
jgi:hypothetical protein